MNISGFMHCQVGPNHFLLSPFSPATFPSIYSHVALPPIMGLKDLFPFLQEKSTTLLFYTYLLSPPSTQTDVS
jgi:hypothetical protein